MLCFLYSMQFLSKHLLEKNVDLHKKCKPTFLNDFIQNMHRPKSWYHFHVAL